MAESRPAGSSAGYSFARSGLLTASILLAALLAIGLLWRAHQRAQFHQLTAQVMPQTAAPAMPGGQEALVLNRLVLGNRNVPEFVNATLLPGIGMQVLQLGVTIPGRGVQNLLAAPSLADAANLPVSQVDAAPFHLRLSQPGHPLAGSADRMAGVGATDVSNRTLADGGEATGDFKVPNADGRPSGVEAKVDAVLTGRSFDISVRLSNNALSSREISLDWSPRFAAPNGDLSRWRITVPAKFILVNGTERQAGDSAATSKFGKTLGNTDSDTTYTGLNRLELGDGPAVQLQDAQDRLTLRLVLLSPTIHSVRVRTSGTGRTLTLSFGTDAAFVLQAGESAEWHVRVDAQDRAADAGAGSQLFP